jgi:hypothetical protein
MRALRSWPVLLGSLVLPALPAPAAAQPVGSEFQINTYTTSVQYTFSIGSHLVAAAANANFVVVWQSYFQAGNQIGLRPGASSPKSWRNCEG